MLIERYFAKLGFAFGLAVLNAGMLLMLLGHGSDNRSMRKVGADAVAGALMLALVSFFVYIG
jgi:hypothetical protein